MVAEIVYIIKHKKKAFISRDTAVGVLPERPSGLGVVISSVIPAMGTFLVTPGDSRG